MAILDRLGNILRANINEMLDKAEDPEKMLNQISRDMAEAIKEARAQVAETIAQEHLLRENMERNRRLSAEWEQKAEIAVERGRDDLAREALKRKRDFESNANAYETQLNTQHQMVEKLKTDLQALESKYEDLQRNREMLIARHKVAQAQQKVQQTVSSVSAMDFTSGVGRMEEKVRMEEARAKANSELASSSLDAQLASLNEASEDAEVDDELAALKAKKQGPPPQ
jgi:phage shock protein A